MKTHQKHVQYTCCKCDYNNSDNSRDILSHILTQYYLAIFSTKETKGAEKNRKRKMKIKCFRTFQKITDL